MNQEVFIAVANALRQGKPAASAPRVEGGSGDAAPRRGGRRGARQRRRRGAVQRRLYRRDGGQSTLRGFRPFLGNPKAGVATPWASNH